MVSFEASSIKKMPHTALNVHKKYIVCVYILECDFK